MARQGWLLLRRLRQELRLESHAREPRRSFLLVQLPPALPVACVPLPRQLSGQPFRQQHARDRHDAALHDAAVPDEPVLSAHGFPVRGAPALHDEPAFLHHDVPVQGAPAPCVPVPVAAFRTLSSAAQACRCDVHADLLDGIIRPKAPGACRSVRFCASVRPASTDVQQPGSGNGIDAYRGRAASGRPW